MKTTPNLGLRKPEQTDFYNVDDFNYNADVIDQELTEAKATAQQANQTANQAASDLASHLNDKLQDGVHGLATTQDMTLYVDGTNGDDSNDGLTPQTAFRTIQRAIDVLPRFIDHNVIIQLVDGTYNEDVRIIGFNGKGKLFIKGNNTNPTNVKVRSFAISQNTCLVEIMNCEVTATDAHAISISDSGTPVWVSRVIIQTPSSVAAGIRLSFGVTRISQCTISNRYWGIIGHNLSRIHSYNNGGSGNTFALYIGEGSVLAKYGSQPTGTTNEHTWAGGVIR